MNLAVVGCGFVAESYCKTLPNHPDLRLVGAYDIDTKRLDTFCNRWRSRRYATFEDLLTDPAVELVLNLTNPRQHYSLTRQSIEAGKHVYSEKPLAMDAVQARELVELARQKAVYLACSPCSLLGETAQTVWKALRLNAIGKVRLVYANFEDGMIDPTLSPWLWRNESGIAWPAKDEFEVGCTYEHAGYILTWLAAFFGPALRVNSYASCLIPDKGIAVDVMAPDFTVGCIEYNSGIVARVTFGLVAPQDKSLTIIGDGGILVVPNLRSDISPVYMRSIPPARITSAIERRVNRVRAVLGIAGMLPEWRVWRKYPMPRVSTRLFAGPDKLVDFCRGPAELADAIRENRQCRLSPELAWHITELIERLQYPEQFVGQPNLSSTFEPIEPLPTTH
jgi:predicted dehydrogenase